MQQSSNLVKGILVNAYLTSLSEVLSLSYNPGLIIRNYIGKSKIFIQYCLKT